MLLRQYVYFALSSEHITAREMTAVLGIEPDETSVRGSRRTAPVALPACHRWKISCREPGLRVDEQIANILGRLQPHTERIAALVARLATEVGPGAAVLQVVRYFNDSPGEAGEADQAIDQPPKPLSWHLDHDVLSFLSATGATIDVDEYDMTPEPAQD